MTPLHGVVLAGGISRRMGRDKALLSYDGCTPQLERVATILAQYCASVEVACRPEQVEAWSAGCLVPFRADAYPAFGPLAGILTALDAHPEKAVLAIACDLPFLTPDILTHLVEGRRENCWATAFTHEDGFVEPLCAIYEPQAREALRNYMTETGRCSPREALGRPDVTRLPLPNPEALTNVNAPDEYARACALIQDSRGESSQDHP